MSLKFQIYVCEMSIYRILVLLFFLKEIFPKLNQNNDALVYVEFAARISVLLARKS